MGSAQINDVLAATKAASTRWMNAFNSGDGPRCAAQYETTATMNVQPFGTFVGTEAIAAFWSKLIADGFADVAYIEPKLEVVDEKTVLLSAGWRMNKAGGVITKELWVLQDDGSAKLREDHFEVISTTQPPAHVNGIDTEALRACIAGCKQDPVNAKTHWHVHSTWMGGTRTDHRVDAFHMAGERIERSPKFTIKIDEPQQLCGSNLYANPQEYLISALNACMLVGFAAVAALMDIRLDSLEVETSGDIDLRGFLGIDPSIAPGYESLTQTIRISADATDELLQTLHNTVKATSPNFYNITRAVPTNSTMVITRAVPNN